MATKKSKGHLSFDGHFEYYSAEGQVIKAPIANVFVNGYRLGRFECSLEQAKRYPTVYPFLAKN